MTITLYIIVFFLFTIIALAVFVVVWLVSVPLDRLRRPGVWHASRAWAISIYRLCPWWRVNIEGASNLPKEPCILISNHQHMLDIPLLLQVPVNFRFVSKREVYKIPIFGWVLYLRDDIAIERGGASSAKKMINDAKRVLNGGVSVAIFPEGTRTKTGQIGEFHQGAFLMATRTKVPLVPIVLDGNFDAFKGGKIDFHHKFTIKILPPVMPSELENMTLDEISGHLEGLIKTAFDKIQKAKKIKWRN